MNFPWGHGKPEGTHVAHLIRKPWVLATCDRYRVYNWNPTIYQWKFRDYNKGVPRHCHFHASSIFCDIFSMCRWCNARIYITLCAYRACGTHIYHPGVWTSEGFILLFGYILREPDAIRKMMLAVRFPVRNTVMVPASLQGRVVLGMVQIVEVDRIPSCLPVRWQSSEIQQKHLVWSTVMLRNLLPDLLFNNFLSSCIFGCLLKRHSLINLEW